MSGRGDWQASQVRRATPYLAMRAQYELAPIRVCSRAGRMLALADGSKLLDFISCSYLGLDIDPRVVAATSASLTSLGVHIAAARTRIQAEPIDRLERLCRDVFANRPCVSFSSTTLVHLGALPLLGSGTVPGFPLRGNAPRFLLDRQAHASMKVQRSNLKDQGEVVSVDAANISTLTTAFKAARSAGCVPILVADGVGSMGGLADVVAYSALAAEHDGYLYLDDAHGVSVQGIHGCGFVLAMLPPHARDRALVALSLSKGFGVGGALLSVPTESTAAFFRQHAMPYLFGGPPFLPLAEAACASAKIHLSTDLRELQAALWTNVELFDSLVDRNNVRILNIGTRSPIRGVVLGDEAKVFAATRAMRERGCAATPAVFPTVRENEAMMRLTFAANHTAMEVRQLVESLTTSLGEINEGQ